ncbi:hypothetical protein L1987_09076 [Smallanthus sonchifolius]|uniref:Uncharacterized protein n=1 Tax=Smallanthus sonchifolius TaxID=185202 RepID=A0ACB9JP56_9ASTR|nr:hypothetical protein L1987_09076 [Smallanthus sonchifolius]
MCNNLDPFPVVFDHQIKTGVLDYHRVIKKSKSHNVSGMCNNPDPFPIVFGHQIETGVLDYHRVIKKSKSHNVSCMYNNPNPFPVVFGHQIETGVLDYHRVIKKSKSHNVSVMCNNPDPIPVVFGHQIETSVLDYHRVIRKSKIHNVSVPKSNHKHGGVVALQSMLLGAEGSSSVGSDGWVAVRVMMLVVVGDVERARNLSCVSFFYTYLHPFTSLLYIPTPFTSLSLSLSLSLISLAVGSRDLSATIPTSFGTIDLQRMLFSSMVQKMKFLPRFR